MALHLLSKDRTRGLILSDALEDAMKQIDLCTNCRNYTEEPVCRICSDPNRESGLLCIVENALDVMAIETANNFNGYYFVLHGRISPLDGIGPEALGIETLRELLNMRNIEEVILATNATIEGEATAHYITELLGQFSPHTQVSRIAHGIPVGGELEMTSSNTLAYALADRKLITNGA